jgi:regulator of replication initiation timing
MINNIFRKFFDFLSKIYKLLETIFQNKYNLVLFLFMFSFICLVISNDLEITIFNEWMVTFAKLYIHSLNIIFNGIQNSVKECFKIFLNVNYLVKRNDYLSEENEKLRLEIDELKNKIKFLELIIYKTKKFNLISNFFSFLDKLVIFYFRKNNTIHQNSVLNSLDSIISNLDFMTRFFTDQVSSDNKEEPKNN